MTATEIAQHYFDLSNESDFESIQLLFSETTTYRSGNGELFLGMKDIMVMQKSYHGLFDRLNWQVNSIDEIKPGIILIDFNFEGDSKSGDKIEYSGLESIIVYREKIQHIDVSRK